MQPEALTGAQAWLRKAQSDLRAIEILIKDSDFKNIYDYKALWAFVVNEENAEELFEMYSKACLSRPDYYGFYLPIAECLYSLKRYEEAIENYDKWREHVSANPVNSSIGKARCYLAMGNNDLAKKYIKNALVEDPTSQESEKLRKRLE